MNVVIRNASLQDLPEVLSILNYEISNGTATFDYTPKHLPEVEAYFNQRVADGFPFLVAIINNVVVGYATYGPFRFKEGYKYTVEHSVYIHHDYHNKGIGRKLLLELISIAKQSEIKSMIAGIAKENKGSIAFHKKLEFNEVGSIPFAAKKFDRWLELVFLQLIII